MKITLYEFLALPDQEQYDIVFNSGQFLTYHLDENKKFALYAVSKFFVEIEYDAANNKIVSKRSFISGEKLNRYSNIKGIL